MFKSSKGIYLSNNGQNMHLMSGTLTILLTLWKERKLNKEQLTGHLTITAELAQLIQYVNVKSVAMANSPSLLLANYPSLSQTIQITKYYIKYFTNS